MRPRGNLDGGWMVESAAGIGQYICFRSRSGGLIPFRDIAPDNIAALI